MAKVMHEKTEIKNIFFLFLKSNYITVINNLFSWNYDK